MKTKNAKLILATIVTILFVVTGCRPKDDGLEEVTLSLSKTEFQLDNKEQTVPPITVTTNQPKWRAISLVSWITTTEKGTSLIIKAEANNDGKSREGKILISAGSMTEVISVTQGASDLVIKVDPDLKIVPQSGAVFIVDIRSNTEQWEVAYENEESDAKWIKMRKLATGLLEVTVDVNKEKETRTTKLIAKAGKTIAEIEIKQAGTGGARFKLPLLKKSALGHEVLTYEKEQGNHFILWAGAATQWGIYQDMYKFIYSSDLFQTVEYRYDARYSNKMYSIYMEAKGGEETLKSEEFKDFLKKEGFIPEIPDAQTGSYLAFDKSRGLKMKVEIAKDFTEVSSINIQLVIRQDKSYPTFEKFDYDNSSYLRDKAWSLEKIAEKESQNGSIIVNKGDYQGTPLHVALAKSHAPKHARLYFMHKSATEVPDPSMPVDPLENTLEELIVIWDKVELGVFVDEFGEPFVTTEFIKLLEKEGFVFYTSKEDALYYYHKAKKLMVVPRGTRFSAILGGKLVFSINYLYDDGAALNKKSVKDRNAYVDMLSKRIANHDKHLGKM